MSFGQLNVYAARAHGYARRQGFWDGLIGADGEPDVNTTLMKLALITEEVGEAVSAARVKDVANFEEELADICIRVFDLAEAHHVNLERCILNKMSQNEGRPKMHGKLA